MSSNGPDDRMGSQEDVRVVLIREDGKKKQINNDSVWSKIKRLIRRVR